MSPRAGRGRPGMQLGTEGALQALLPWEGQWGGGVEVAGTGRPWQVTSFSVCAGRPESGLEWQYNFFG